MAETVGFEVLVAIVHPEMAAEGVLQRWAKKGGDGRIIGMLDAHLVERVSKAVDDAGR